MITDSVEVLRTAQTVLGVNGWHQGGFYNRAAELPPASSPVDLYGALALAAGADAPMSWGGPGSDDAMGLLRAVLYARGEWVGLAEWNDEPGRTVEDVLSLLDAAVERFATRELVSR